MTGWPELVGAVGGAVGAFTGVGALLYARRADDSSRRSADASERSAIAADKSAAAAQDVVNIEAERDHDRLAPVLPDQIKAALSDTRYLHGSIRVDRDYRVRAEAVWDNNMWRISLPGLLRAGQDYDFSIEGPWPADRDEPQAKEVRLKFWPPAAIDDVEHWACPCDRPASERDERTPGHWERRIRVDYYDPVKSVW